MGCRRCHPLVRSTGSSSSGVSGGHGRKAADIAGIGLQLPRSDVQEQPDGGGLARRLPAAAASPPKRPPTSMPMTTRRQRRARVSSGYVSRLLRRAALFAAHPGCVSARRCGSPDRVTGETMVASSASCAPCHRGRPLATTSMRRASATRTSMLMSPTRTLRETRAPASWQTLAAARSCLGFFRFRGGGV